MQIFKYLVLSGAFFLMISATGTAQISECTGVMSKGSHPCFSFTMDNMDERTAFQTFRSHVRSEYRTRVRRDRREDEFTASEVNIMSIHPTNELNIYAKFNEAGGSVEVRVWFEMGDDFISTEKYPQTEEGIIAFMENFKRALVREQTKEILSNQENELQSLERQLRRLKRDKDGYEGDIRDAEEAIKEARKNIEKNLQNQAEAEVSIQNQRNKIEQTKQKLRELEQ